MTNKITEEIVREFRERWKNCGNEIGDTERSVNKCFKCDKNL